MIPPFTTTTHPPLSLIERGEEDKMGFASQPLGVSRFGVVWDEV